MKKKIYMGIDEQSRTNQRNFMNNPEASEIYKEKFPNESEILINGYDRTEWCDWSHALTHWEGFLAGFIAGGGVP